MGKTHPYVHHVSSFLVPLAHEPTRGKEAGCKGHVERNGLSLSVVSWIERRLQLCSATAGRPGSQEPSLHMSCRPRRCFLLLGLQILATDGTVV